MKATPADTNPRRLARERLLSVTELAAQWSVDRHTVVRLLDQAGVQAIYLSGQAYGTRRYAERDIEAFLKSRQATSRPLADGALPRKRSGARRKVPVPRGE